MKDADLVIIGGGIIGVMSAYLAREERPDWRILLLDRSLIGSGATQYSVGLDIPYGGTPAHRQLSEASTTTYRKLKELVPELSFNELPFFGIVNSDRVEAVRSGFTKEVHPATAAEFDSLLMSYPDLRISDHQVLLTGCTASYAAPALVAGVLVDRLKQTSAFECWEGVEVQEIRRQTHGFELTASGDRRISAARVLSAVGPWLPDGPGAVEVKSAGVRVKKVVALHVNRPPVGHEPVLLFFDDDAFLLPVRQRREWIFSFASEEWDCKPEVSRLTITADDRSTALSILDRYCPSMVPDCNGGRVFCDAYTPDRIPLVMHVSTMPNFVVAGAAAGSGFRLAPAIARKALAQFS